MAASNINRVTITGNLTKDPDLRQTNSGMSVCSLRVAVNSRRKDAASGEWVDQPNYFSVTVFGRQGETANQYLAKGRPVAVDGRLSWREYVDKNENKRESVEIIADTVQFLSGPEGGGGGGQQSGGQQQGGAQQQGSGQSYTPGSDIQADTTDFGPPQPQPVPAGGGAGFSSPQADDDIPF